MLIVQFIVVEKLFFFAGRLFLDGRVTSRVRRKRKDTQTKQEVTPFGSNCGVTHVRHMKTTKSHQ